VRGSLQPASSRVHPYQEFEPMGCWEIAILGLLVAVLFPGTIYRFIQRRRRRRRQREGSR